MNIFNWKDKYLSTSGIDVSSVGKYYSILGSSEGIGSRDDPSFSGWINTDKDYPYHIFSSGYHNTMLNMVKEGSYYCIGQGKTDTYLNLSLGGGNYKKQAVLINLNCIMSESSISYGAMFNNCIINNKEGDDFQAISITKSVVIKGNLNPTHKDRYVSTTMVQCNIGNQLSNLMLYNACDIAIQQTTLNSFHERYIAFNNCNFAIGAEPKATPLEGNTADELRQNFIDRCAAQNLTLRVYDEYGERNSVGRWIFSNTSIIGQYNTLENSEIDMFAKKRSVILGHTSQTYKNLPIVTAQNVPNSFASSNPKSGIDVADGSLTLNTPVDKRNVGYIDSKIIYLGGKHQLTTLNIANTLSMENGVSIDSTYSFGRTTSRVSPNINYIVMSSNAEQARVRYNNVEYSSSLMERNNIFRGVDGVASFDTLTHNAVVLPIVDLANHQSIQMRLVSDIPTQKITGTSGLQSGYWYLVVPNDMSDPDGSVTYKGVKHPPFDSFLADSTSTFAINGECHLRRCWRQNYEIADETTDKSFWQSRQKPLYFDVLPNDLRAMRKNNVIAENEMMMDANQQYIASGHIDFYNSIVGVNGIKLPAFNLIGTFLQIRVPISTLNPM